MDLLDPSPVALLPQALWLTYRTIALNPGLDDIGVLDRIVPVEMRDRTPIGPGKHVLGALEALVRLGLVDRAPDGLAAEKVSGSAEFLRRMRRRVVCPPEQFGAEFDAPTDLRNGLIWLMRQSPAKALDYDVDIEPHTKVFLNPSRWNIFRPWCEILGFGQVKPAELTSRGATTGQKVVPNPTGAVVDAIQSPDGEGLPIGERISITELVGFLQEQIPVLPGHPSATYPGLAGSADEAFESLGIALAGAEERGLLSMEFQSDPSGVMALADYNGRTRYVSSVSIRKRAA